MRNREALIMTIWTVLSDWAQVEGYLMPSIAYLLKYDVQLHEANDLPSSTKGLRALANCNNSLQLIQLAMNHDNSELISSMVHEYSHAIQFYNLGARFTPLYAESTAAYGYTHNKFELQARGAQSCLKSWVGRDTFLRRAIQTFKWLRRSSNWIPLDDFDLDDVHFYDRPRLRDWQFKRGFWYTHQQHRM